MAKIILNLSSTKDEDLTIEIEIQSDHLLEERDNVLLKALGSLVSRFENASVNGKEYNSLTADFVVGEYFIYLGESNFFPSEEDEDEDENEAISLKT